MRSPVLLLGLLALTPVALAHPYHVSLAEAKVNAPQKRLEVALRVFPEDLETALQRRHKRDIDIERTEGVDELITAYLREVFTLRDPVEAPIERGSDGLPPPRPPRFVLTWVGKEVEPRHAWLYFTIALDRTIEGLEISNRALFEVEPTQENTIVLTDGERRVTISCNIERQRMVVEFPPSDGESAPPEGR